MDYIAEANGSTLVGHYTSRYKNFDGLLVATRRNPDNTVNLNLPSITVDIHDVELGRLRRRTGTAITTRATALEHPSRNGSWRCPDL